ncbi:endothelin-converting enzyme 1-like [Dermacentor albipictus]|uniref:endothelin-converting enzyme 1-like n=1 Tax=Dermacentor albipictus TaxID=60249 RepID=UPI0031FC8E6E
MPKPTSRRRRTEKQSHQGSKPSESGPGPDRHSDAAFPNSTADTGAAVISPQGPSAHAYTGANGKPRDEGMQSRLSALPSPPFVARPRQKQDGVGSVRTTPSPTAPCNSSSPISANVELTSPSPEFQPQQQPEPAVASAQSSPLGGPSPRLDVVTGERANLAIPSAVDTRQEPRAPPIGVSDELREKPAETPAAAQARATTAAEELEQQAPSQPSPQVKMHGDLPAAKAVVGGRSNERHAPKAKASFAVEARKPSAAELYHALENLGKFAETPPESGTPRPTSFLRKKLIIALSVVCVGVSVLFMFAVFVVIAKKPIAVASNLCRTEDCDQHAILLTSRLDPKLDPCEDFAAFVCSAWRVSRAHREHARSVIDDLRFSWYDHFENTLKRGALSLAAARKPHAMYTMCRHYFPANLSQMELIFNLIKEYKLQWPEPPTNPQDPLSMLVLFSYKWELHFWITVNYLEHSLSGKRRILVRPGLYLSILLNQHQAVAQSYVRYWKQYLYLLHPNASTRPTVNEKLVNEIWRIEDDVLNSLQIVAASPRKSPALFSFGKVRAYVPNASVTLWREAFQRGMSLQPALTDDDEIAFSDVSYIRMVSELLAKYSEVQINMHITWLALQYYAPVADYSVLVGYYGSREKAEEYLPVYCAHKTEAAYKVLVQALGFHTRFTDQDRTAIDAGFQSLVSTAVGKINSARWMGDEERARAADKVASIRMALWPPKSLLDNDTLEGLYANFPEKAPSFAQYWIQALEAAARVNRTADFSEALLLLGSHFSTYADYDYISNVVRVAMGAVAKPAYYSHGTKGMLYGGLLFLVALQLVRAIDDEGIRWGPNDSALGDSTFSAPALEAYRARSQCQHGANDSGSAFPDVPALEIAYSALKESRFRNESEPTALSKDLPELKVFFMTLCYMACASPGGRSSITADCNKVVRNSWAFAEAYRCPKGSKMNPEKKCSFFA